MGMVSPVGSTVPTAWDAILNGRSGIGPITRFDVSAFPVRFGGQVRDFDLGAGNRLLKASASRESLPATSCEKRRVYIKYKAI